MGPFNGSHSPRYRVDQALDINSQGNSLHMICNFSLILRYALCYFSGLLNQGISSERPLLRVLQTCSIGFISELCGGQSINSVVHELLRRCLWDANPCVILPENVPIIVNRNQTSWKHSDSLLPYSLAFWLCYRVSWWCHFETAAHTMIEISGLP